MHVYVCAECRKKFKTEGHAAFCPVCHCKILIHLEGEPRKKKGCSGACSPGCSCGH